MLCGPRVSAEGDSAVRLPIPMLDKGQSKSGEPLKVSAPWLFVDPETGERNSSSGLWMKIY